MQKASERERKISELFLRKVQEAQELIAKDNVRGDEMSKTLAEWAIYDNGDLRSLNN